MPPVPPPKNERRTQAVGIGPPSVAQGAAFATAIPTSATDAGASVEMGIAVTGGTASGGVVTARRAGGLRDMALEVDPDKVGVKAAMQHLAKAVNIAFQTDYGENYLEAVYQAAILRNGELQIVHKEYFGFRDTWFGQLGMLLKSMQLTFQGPDPASPEGQKQIAEHGASTIRGLFNFLGRKLELVTEFEDRVPAYVEQMFDRLEASGIITGWDRADWRISTTKIGLNIRVVPTMSEMEEESPGEG